METSLVLVKKVSFSLFYHLESNCGKIIPLTTRVPPLTTKELVPIKWKIENVNPSYFLHHVASEVLLSNSWESFIQ